MAVKIGHASIDERGKARGGAAGDQTGKEVCLRDWYDKNWVSVLRPKNEKEAEKMAKAMEQACELDELIVRVPNDYAKITHTRTGSLISSDK